MPMVINELDNFALVDTVLDYLSGVSNSRIKAALDEQCEEKGIACKQRYAQITTCTRNYDACVELVLNALFVPEDDRRTYRTAPNLYVLLKKLEPRYRHLTHLIRLIDQSNPPKSWAKPFLVVAFMIAGSALLLSFKKKYVTHLSLFAQKATVHLLYGLQRTLRLVKNTPLLGILINGIALLWAWYQAFSDGLGLDHDKASILFSKTIENAFPIVACLLCFFAGGVMTTPAMALFIVGSAIDAVVGLYAFIKHERESLPTQDLEEPGYYFETARARVAILRQRDISILLVNLAATALITASVVIWCVFPPSWIITASCVAFGWLVGMFKLLSISHLNHTSANYMQQVLKEITNEHLPEGRKLVRQSVTESSYVSMHTYLGLKQEVATLKDEIRQLQQQALAQNSIQYHCQIFSPPLPSDGSSSYVEATNASIYVSPSLGSLNDSNA